MRQSSNFNAFFPGEEIEWDGQKITRAFSNRLTFLVVNVVLSSFFFIPFWLYGKDMGA